MPDRAAPAGRGGLAPAQKRRPRPRARLSRRRFPRGPQVRQARPIHRRADRTGPGAPGCSAGEAIHPSDHPGPGHPGRASRRRSSRRPRSIGSSPIIPTRKRQSTPQGSSWKPSAMPPGQPATSFSPSGRSSIARSRDGGSRPESTRRPEPSSMRGACSRLSRGPSRAPGHRCQSHGSLERMTDLTIRSWGWPAPARCTV